MSVLSLGTIAAVTASVGPAVLAGTGAVRARVIGYADALAAGMMLGLGYALMAWGIARGPTIAVLGATAGVGAMWWIHVQLHLDDAVAGQHPRLAWTGAVVHAIPEGIALGAAAALSASVAVAVAATLAVHNISESAVLASRSPVYARGRGAIAAAASNAPQIVFGVIAFAIGVSFHATLAPMLGASFGALMYLSFAELLPESYRLAGRSGIAVVVTIAAGIVALISGTV